MSPLLRTCALLRRASGYAAFLVLLTFSTTAVAQERGAIVGTVIDADFGDPLTGANVVIVGTTIGSSTDMDGRYRISDLEPGSYDIQARFIGFEPVTVTGVEVNAGEETEIDITMGFDSVELDEVVVEARAIANTEGVLLRERQKASAVSDAISAEAIGRSGAGDAAAAMSQVTGASVQGGKYVFVRGLGDRYSATQLNGSRLPSSDPDRNSVQLDLLPANLIDNIVTLKTFTPDKPGSFSGGLVDIGTKDFPSELNASLSVSTGFNTQAHLSDDFLLYPSGDNDWLGFDDGSRALPDFFDSIEPGTLPRGNQIFRADDAEEVALLDAASKAFNGVMAPVQATPPVNQSYSLSFGNEFGIGSVPVGFIGSLSYGRSASYRDGTSGRYSVTDGQAGVLDQDFFVGDVRGSTETSWGGLLNLSVRPLPSQEVGVNVFYSRSAETYARFQEGIFPDIADGTIQNRALGFTERDLLTVQLRGEHVFSRLGRSTLEWAALRGRTTQEEPDLRFFANFIQPSGTFAATGSGIEAPSRFFRDLTEDSQDYKADLTVPFRFRGEAARFKAGGAFARSVREFSERSFEVGTNTGSDASFRYDGDPERYFSDTHMGVVDTTYRRNGDINRFVFANFIEETTAPENTYDGEMDIAAAYGMIEVPITGSLRMIAGARVEWTDLELISQAALEDDVVDVTTRDSALVSFQDYTDVLPSLNLVYALTDNANLRFAATRTLARPTFREVAPFTSFDFLYGDLYVGNPELERTLINNLDLRWEWFSRPGEIIAVSGFYKLFENPIEQTLTGGLTRQRKYSNVDEATVMGLEFEARKALDQISSRLENFSLGGNASIVHSRINLGENELAIRRAVDPEAEDTRELQGQSPYIINLDLAYDNPDSGTTVGLYYNVFGRRLAQVTLGAAPDVYERPRPVLDLTVAQKLIGGAQAKLSAKNLLNSDYRETYRFQDQDFDFYTYELGRTFSLSVSYRL